ncbi:YbaL family putative K(+) efflux transporter [Dokdonella ginsengisoli]|uniref:YbaL family putative K(+) efflux transporter n=1 Tax=Dokdonella ginsengisoli TaxID=363846 RepID=A0ABV9QWP4_9GAMM
MPHHTPLIATLVSAFVLAFVAGMLAQRLRLSPIVGYLLAGVVIGPFTPGIVADQAIAPELSELGVILLMFGVGLHFSLGDLLEVKAIAIPGAIAQIAFATGLGLLLAWGLDWSFGAGLVFGLALSVASTVVLLRALEERRLLETSRGRIAVGWLIVEDLAMVLALVLLPALSGLLGGRVEGGGGNLFATLGLTLGKVTAFVAIMLIVGRRVIPWLLERTAGVGSRELFTLAVLAIALGVAYASAVLFGVSFALGAFFAGMVLNESKLSHQAANDSLPFRDAFAVLFFVSVGMLFDPAILLREPLPVLGVFLIITVGKSLAALVIVRAFGRPLEVGVTIAVSLAQIGEFSFILAGLGVDLGLLPKDGRDLILAGSILSICANPLLFVALDRWQAKREAEAAANAPEPDEPIGPPVPEAGHIVLVGFGRVGALVGRDLQASGHTLALIETNRDHLEQARALGIAGVPGNAAAEETLVAVNAATATALLIAIPNTLEAGQIIRHARAQNPSIAVLARAHSDDEVAYLLGCGADAAIMGEREIARSMCESVGGLERYFARRRDPDFAGPASAA